MSNGRSLGQVAYEGYAEHAGWNSLISGAQLPPWDNQSAEVQQAWQAGAEAVYRSLPRSDAAGIEYRLFRVL